MQAIRQYELGGPEVLLYEEVPDLEQTYGKVVLMPDSLL
jgi:hypothetical protein